MELGGWGGTDSSDKTRHALKPGHRDPCLDLARIDSSGPEKDTWPKNAGDLGGGLKAKPHRRYATEGRTGTLPTEKLRSKRARALLGAWGRGNENPEHIRRKYGI